MQFPDNPDDLTGDPADDQADDDQAHDQAHDQADELDDGFGDDAEPGQCSRVVLRRLVDALTASLEASGIEPDPDLAAALEVARAELEWTS